MSHGRQDFPVLTAPQSLCLPGSLDLPQPGKRVTQGQLSHARGEAEKEKVSPGETAPRRSARLPRGTWDLGDRKDVVQRHAA